MKTPIPLDVEIRSRLADVLSEKSSLQDFYFWFIPATLDTQRTEGAETVRLSEDLIHLFSELSAGLLTPRELRDALETAARPNADQRGRHIA